MKRVTSLVAALAMAAMLAACSAPAQQASAPTAAPVVSETPIPAPQAAPDEPALTPEPTTAPKAKGETIAANDIDPNGGADSYASGGDNPDSRYYVNMDFFNAKPDDMLTIIPNYRTYQQTAEWSCGNATALMALHHFGIESYTEWDIAVAMGSSTDEDTEGAEPGSANNFFEYGTNVAEMTKFFESVEGVKVLETSYREGYAQTDLLTADSGKSESYLGNLAPTFSAMALYTSENSDESEAWVEDAKDSFFVKWLTGHIVAGNVVMVEWADWDGHWTGIIGYDNNGTPGIGDDILIFADPYDTSDHWQDGYAIYPMERWFYIWNDRTVAPKPFQTQPYLVVGKA